MDQPRALSSAIATPCRSKIFRDKVFNVTLHDRSERLPKSPRQQPGLCFPSTSALLGACEVTGFDGLIPGYLGPDLAVTTCASPRLSTRSGAQRRPIRSCLEQPSCVRHNTAAFVSKDYELLQDLGRGAFGQCFLVQERSSKEERVCKVVSTAGMSSKSVERMREEVTALRTLDHPHIVSIFEYSQDLELRRLVLILEYIPGDSCSALLKHSGPLKERFVVHLSGQILSALAHCHSRGVVHRDLKPQHFMLTKPTNGQDPDCKIIDFGLAVALCSGGASLDRAGTPAYMAPEVIGELPQCQHSDAAPVDIWSMGVSVLELLTGKQAFSKGSTKRTWQNIKEFNDFGTLLATLDDPSSSTLVPSLTAYDFIGAMLRPIPSSRLAAQELRRHPWLQLRHMQKNSVEDPVACSLAFAEQVQRTPATSHELVVSPARQGKKLTSPRVAAWGGTPSRQRPQLSLEQTSGVPVSLRSIQCHAVPSPTISGGGVTAVASGNRGVRLHLSTSGAKVLDRLRRSG